MSRDNQKASTPVPQEATPAPTKPKGKKFSFSFGFLRKEKGDKAFSDKVAPSKRELETRATKRREQRAKAPAALKQQVIPATEPEEESEEQEVQPV